MTHSAILDVSLDRNDQNNRDGLRLCSFAAKNKIKTKVILVTGTVSLQDINLNGSKIIAAWICEKTKYDRKSFQEKILEIEGVPLARGKRAPLFAKLEFSKRRERGFALVVEDDEEWQEILKEALEAEGFSTTLIKDFPSALGEVRRKAYSIVTIDLELESSQDPEGNRYGRILIPEVHELGIPLFIVSAKLSKEEVLADYKQYKNIIIIDKAAFSISYFRECIREISTQTQQVKPQKISTDLVYKVVQTFLRNYNKLDRDFSRKAEILEISRKLEEPIDALILRLRDDIDRIINDFLEDAVREEIKELKVEEIEFKNHNDFLTALISSLQGDKGGLAIEKVWPLHTKLMREFLVLDALYRRGCEYEKMSLALQSRLAVEEGALNRMRSQGIKEIASILRSGWLRDK